MFSALASSYEFPRRYIEPPQAKLVQGFALQISGILTATIRVMDIF